MPRVTFDVTEEDQRMMIAVCGDAGAFRAATARKWHQKELKKAYNRLPQSVLDNLASDKNE
jgi:hypothetical protein